MGTWDESIFGNDAACDVRDQYQERVDAGDDAAAAVKHVRCEFAELLRDTDDKHVVWIALAASQLLNGSTSDDVRTRALKSIAWSLDPAKGLESSPFGEEALEQLWKQLDGPPRNPAKPPKPAVAAGAPGEVLAVKVPTKNREAIVVVVGPSQRGPAWTRMVMVADVKPAGLKVEQLLTALQNWRPEPVYRDRPEGRKVGVWDVEGKLPRTAMRRLFDAIELPASFLERLDELGPVEKGRDLPQVIYNDLSIYRGSD